MAQVLLQHLQEFRTLLQDSSLSETQKQEVKQHVDALQQAVQNTTVAPTTIASAGATSDFQIWSDGACIGNPGPGGWGTIIEYAGQRTEISGYSPQSTNNIMEMTGALEGILKTPVGSKITVTSDSQYVVKGMNEWRKGWKRRNWKKSDGNTILNKEIWIRLDQEDLKRKVTWKWVKGHAGHAENERCDELAGLAIQTKGVSLI
ncbi:MAG: ribonuclease HI [bacterium]|jgi:ribonuclease HI